MESEVKEMIIEVEGVVFTGEQAKVVQFLLERLKHAENERFYGQPHIVAR